MNSYKRIFLIALVALSFVSESVYANGFSLSLNISSGGGGVPCPPPMPPMQMPCPPPQMPCPPVAMPMPPQHAMPMPMPMPAGGGMYAGGGYVRVQAGGYRPVRRRGGCRQVSCRRPCGGRVAKRCFGRSRC